jgi:hypothetical protein
LKALSYIKLRIIALKALVPFLKFKKAFFRSVNILNMRYLRFSVDQRINGQWAFQGNAEVVPGSADTELT